MHRIQYLDKDSNDKIQEKRIVNYVKRERTC